jgi:predicted small metal-binding protein
MKTLSCREADFDCEHVVKGETEEEILNNGKQHAIMDHGMREEDCTSEFKEKLEGLIKSEGS